MNPEQGVPGCRRVDDRQGRNHLVARPFIWQAVAGAVLFALLPLKSAVAACIFLLLARWAITRNMNARWLPRVLGLEPEAWEADAPAPRNAPWVGGGCGVVLLAFALAECIQPYYFTQDDSFCCLLPVVLQAGRELFSGVFPNYNPCQFLGWSPMSEATFSLAYPPVYLAYAIARFMLRNEYMAFECMAFITLMQGFLSTYWAARMWRLRPSFAACAGLSFILSGTTLVMGRSWSNFLMVLPYLSLMAGFLGILRHKPVHWRWSVALGMVIGIAYYASLVQMWVYGLLWLLAGAAVLVVCGASSFRKVLWLIPALLLGIAISAPLLYVQMDTASNIAREDSGFGIIGKDLLAILLPYPFTHARHPQSYGVNLREYMGMYLYSGTILPAAAGVGLALGVLVRWPRRAIAANMMLIGALIALLFAFGDKAGLWWLMRHIPLFHYFRNAERFLVLFNLCAALSGALILQRLIGAFRWRSIWETSLACVVAALMLYTVSMARASFYSFEAKPYPPLPEYISHTLQPAHAEFPQRVASLTPWDVIPVRSVLHDYPFTLEQHFASAYGYLSMSGWDPLVWNHDFYGRYVRHRLERADLAFHDPSMPNAPDCRSSREAIYKAYGVQWVLVFEPFVPRFTHTFPELGESDPSRPVRILPVENTSPLAFAEANPSKPFPIRLDGHGATVNVSELPQGGPFIVNILAWPRFRVYADGKSVPFAPDEWGRMRVDIPPGTQTLDAAYCPPWGMGFACMLGLLIVALMMMAVLARFDAVRPGGGQ